jgi:hypothetical protein
MPDAALVTELRSWLAFYEPVSDAWLRGWAERRNIAITYLEDIPPRLQHLQPHDAAFILKCREIQRAREAVLSGAA